MAINLKLRIISSTLAALLFASSAQAQTQRGNWRAVENVRPGTDISVKARRRHYCSFVHANANEIVCDVRRPFWRSSRVVIPRGEVREVRVPRSQAQHGQVGAAIGAGAVAVAGASRARRYRGVNACIGALFGMLCGGLIGMMVPIFRRGKIIYKA